jgi:hypothetical protein
MNYHANSPKISPEMIAAWRTLQEAAHLHPSIRRAVNILDNSEYMTPIERAEEELEDTTELQTSGTVQAQSGTTVIASGHRSIACGGSIGYVSTGGSQNIIDGRPV